MSHLHNFLFGAGGALGYLVYLGTDGNGTRSPSNAINGVYYTQPQFSYNGDLQLGVYYYLKVSPLHQQSHVPLGRPCQWQYKHKYMHYLEIQNSGSSGKFPACEFIRWIIRKLG